MLMDKKSIKKISDIVFIICIVVLFLRMLHTWKLAYVTAMKYPNGQFDFQWDAAKLLTEKINPYIESLYHNTAYDGKYIPFFGKVEANQFPSMLWCLFPYTFFNVINAKNAWYITNCVCTVGSILIGRILCKNINKKDYILAILLVLCSSSYESLMGVGQHTIFSLFFFLLSMWICDKYYNKNSIIWITLASFFLGVSWFKYTITLPITGYFIYKKWIKPVIGALAFHIGLMCFSSYWLSCSIKDLIVFPLKISFMLENKGFIDLGVWIECSLIRITIMIVMVLLAIICTMRARKEDSLLVLSILSLTSLLIVYHRRYDYIILIFLLLYVISNLRKRISNKGRGIITNIICLAGVWFSLFHDTIISNLGITFIIDAEETLTYKILCSKSFNAT